MILVVVVAPIGLVHRTFWTTVVVSVAVLVVFVVVPIGHDPNETFPVAPFFHVVQEGSVIRKHLPHVWPRHSKETDSALWNLYLGALVVELVVVVQSRHLIRPTNSYHEIAILCIHVDLARRVMMVAKAVALVVESQLDLTGHCCFCFCCWNTETDLVRHLWILVKIVGVGVGVASLAAEPVAS